MTDVAITEFRLGRLTRSAYDLEHAIEIVRFALAQVDDARETTVRIRHEVHVLLDDRWTVDVEARWPERRVEPADD